MITDKAISPTAALGRKLITVPIITAINQTATVALGMIPGFAGEVTKVEVWASAVTATISVDVAVGSTSVLTGAVTPVATTVTAGTISATPATRRFLRTDQLNIKYTTNGTGAATNLRVQVWVRPYPQAGEA